MAIKQLIRDTAIIAVVAGLTAAASPQEPPAALKIGARDQVTVTVLNQPAYSGRYTVDPAGMIEYAPLSLHLKAAGMSTAELATAIKTELAAKVFRDPQVVVELDQTAQFKVSVMGEVNAPQEIGFSGEMRVFAALARAGSTSANAGDEAILVRANRAGADERVKIDLQALMSGDMKGNVLLHDGDVLIVQKAEPIFVNGYVQHPGQFSFSRGMTVEKAITLAGGFAEQARRNKFKIKRTVNGKPKDLDAKLTDLVQAGDIITVMRSIIGLN